MNGGPLDSAAGVPAELPLDPPAVDEDGIAETIANAHESTVDAMKPELDSVAEHMKSLQRIYKDIVGRELAEHGISSTDLECECLANAINELGG